MKSTPDHTAPVRFPILQGVLPITAARIPAEIIAGITLAAIAIPEVMGYTKISGTPVITGLYTMLIPTAQFALFGSSRHLVVGADSATKRASGTPVATGISNQPLVAAAPQPARNQKNQPRGAGALTKDQACSPPAEAHRRAGLADDE